MSRLYPKGEEIDGFVMPALFREKKNACILGKVRRAITFTVWNCLLSTTSEFIPLSFCFHLATRLIDNDWSNAFNKQAISGKTLTPSTVQIPVFKTYIRTSVYPDLIKT